MKKLSSYLSAGIAATATFQSSDAATVVTLYGPGAQSTSSIPATPPGISFGSLVSGFRVDVNYSKSSYFAAFSDGFINYIFTRGKDLKITGGDNAGRYTNYGSFTNGAQSGSTNYANISFNGNDSVYEAVGQFNFDASGGGFLIAIAISDSGGLSISQGKAAIDAVPEPSAIALLALGAGGMAMRRRRKVA